MPFSVLLLTSASSERHISGYGGDRVSMKSDLLPGEVVLFFDKVDRDVVRNSLGMSATKCCDGIILYLNGRRTIICLVEMKSDDLGKAEMQIKNTYKNLRERLNAECTFCKETFKQISWRAYIYRSGGAPKKDVDTCVDALEKAGFERGNAVVLGNPDITSFLRGDIKTWKRNKSISRT
jgi:hypothetical protein